MITRMFTFVLLVLPLLGQTSSVRLGGVDLRLGMTKESALSKFATDSNVKISEIKPNPDWYMVLIKRTDGTWRDVGDLIFHSGTLARIAAFEYNTTNQEAGRIIKAAYTAIAEAGDVSRVWVETNNDANNPFYEIHLLFKDREIIVSSLSVRDEDESTSVKTYFPRVRTSPASK